MSEGEIVDLSSLNLSDWYTPAQAADRLTRNSGREIAADYPRQLARYGKVRTVKLATRMLLYNKQDIDNYIVEEPGKKSGRAARQRAKPKPKKTTRKPRLPEAA
jgi:hypothetical protein